MKKVIIAAVGLMLSTGVATAADLDTILDTPMGGSMSLSSGVIGTYFSGTDDANFIISTLNNKGTKAYATGSTTPKIYFTGCSSIPCGSATGDLIGTDVTDDDSVTTAVTGFGTVLGGGTGGSGNGG